MFFAERYVCINTSDLFLLSEFLSEDVVYYFVRKASIVFGGLVICSHDFVIGIISALMRLLYEKKSRFCELSFQERIQLIDDLFDANSELKILQQ